MALPCHAVALLVPQSIGAQNAVKARVNHAVIADQPAPVALNGKRGRDVTPFLLTIRTFFGRHSFSFGTSRRNEIVLPMIGGLDTQHLHLHFEIHTSLLLLTDTSNAGTWISMEGSAAPELLRQRTWPLLSTTAISLGEKQQYRFQVRLTKDQRDTEAFLRIFQQYTLSLELSLPLYIKTLASIQDPLFMYEGLYLRLHHVGPARYERINTCLRLSDGRLFAVKTIVNRDISEQPAQVGTASERVGPPPAAVVLRHLTHPHVIRFVDDFTRGHETYIYTEFIPGGSLASMLSQASEGSLSINDIRSVLKQCLFALSYLHGRGISHGSIRAESILIQTCAPLRVRLCNFDRSREEADETQLQADLRDMGTVMTNMLNDVADLSTTCTAPWATLLAGLQQHDSSLCPSVDELLGDAWLLGKCEGKRGRAAEESGEGRAEKRVRGNKDQRERHPGLDEGMDDPNSTPSHWRCIVM